MESPPLSRSELLEEARKLLASLDSGAMSPSAYDTAWVARLRRPDVPDEPLFPEAFDWLLRHQHEDGSWGAEVPFPHDRVVCTLAAVVTLAGSSYRKAEAEVAVRRGVLYLNRERPNLRDDPAETVGFELVLPELVRQAQALGLRLPYEDWAFVEAIKADKLRRIPPIAVYGGPTPLTHSLEYLGDRVAPMLVQRCQSPNGSYGASPAATAYVLTHVTDERALSYLRRVKAFHDLNGVPTLYPIETYERLWAMNYLLPFRNELPDLDAHLADVARLWSPAGIGITSHWGVSDADNTAMAAYLLTLQGVYQDIGPLTLFEGDDYFYTYFFERNPSVTANAHILRALRRYPTTSETRRLILKLVDFLARSRIEGQYWVDKWHASPYYATERAISALAGLSPELVRPAVNWVLATQHEDGSWGVVKGTLEETALAMGTLYTASAGDPALQRLTERPLAQGALYLAAHWDQIQDRQYPALWIGKGLYAPYNVIHAIVLSALVRSPLL
jgi:halimadienyl-diphosphate synthase